MTGDLPSDPVVSNPPGLPALAYRSGTQTSVRRRLLAALARSLPTLAAAAADDPAIALLDAWATVADVVTFYQERIANEGYLGTATERRSVLELARSIGYELRPGVSAETLLDLRTQATAAPATGPLAAPSQVVVAKGTPVLSVPAPGALPQTFETDEEITLDAACDDIPVMRSALPTLGTATTELYVKGVATGLRAGDAILVAEDPQPEGVPPHHDVRVLRTVDPQPATGPDTAPTTKLTWDDALKFEYAKPTVYAFGLRVALFGYNAPNWKTLPDVVRGNYVNPPDTPEDHDTWPGFALADSEVIDLDAAYPDLGKGSFLVMSDPVPPGPQVNPPVHGGTVVYRVVTAEPSAQENFGISAKTTTVTLNVKDGVATFDRRATTVLTRTRELPRAPTPLGGTVGGPNVTDLTLERAAPLTAGRPVLVTGTAAGVPGAPVVPVVRSAQIRTAVPLGKATTITLDAELPEMARNSVRVHGNVVRATHGETVPAEVLGSGDGAVPNQRCTLKKPNVTHLPARGAAGVTDSLEIRVDGVEWKEVASLYPAGPQDRVYVVRIDDDDVATVIFGDGEHGARLPTGQENVLARYRSGIGPAGEVGPHTLIVLPKGPPGVASVDNPIAAGGAAAPETLAQARTNAPLTVLTLDRVVALRDYEDFARAYGGIAKARAVTLHGSRSTFVAVTVTGSEGKAVPPLTLDNLRSALDAVRDLGTELQVLGYAEVRFRLSVAVLAEAARDGAVVRAAVTDALWAAFAVDRRDFGQPVTTAEVLTCAQNVEGVLACLVTELRRDTVPLPAKLVEEVLQARDARVEPTSGDPDHVAPAELLLLGTEPDALDVTEMAP